MITVFLTEKKSGSSKLLRFFRFLFLQFGENRRVLQALRGLLEEFREELREEESRRCQLQQAYASDKAAWEVKWTEMKCRVAQVQMASQCRPFKEPEHNLVRERKKKRCAF